VDFFSFRRLNILHFALVFIDSRIFRDNQCFVQIITKTRQTNERKIQNELNAFSITNKRRIIIYWMKKYVLESILLRLFACLKVHEKSSSLIEFGIEIVSDVYFSFNYRCCKYREESCTAFCEWINFYLSVHFTVRRIKIIFFIFVWNKELCRRDFWAYQLSQAFTLSIVIWHLEQCDIRSLEQFLSMISKKNNTTSFPLLIVISHNFVRNDR